MECFLRVNQLRCFITALCFGCIFLWILCGQYLDQERRYSDAPSTSPEFSLVLASRQSKEQLQRLQRTRGDARFALRRLLEAGEELDRSDNDSDGYDPTTSLVSLLRTYTTDALQCMLIRRCMGFKNLIVLCETIMIVSLSCQLLSCKLQSLSVLSAGVLSYTY